MTRIGSPARVLVVDDSRLVLDTLCDLITELGHESVSSAGGRKALELLASRRYDLVITDLLMPEMGGPALARKLLAERPETSILFMSGHTDHTITRGPPFLQKPFTPDALARTVRAALDVVTRAAVPAGR